MSLRGKYKTLTLLEEMEALNKLDRGASVRDVMNQYGISRTTLYDININLKRTY
jgi:hypothetical protein